MTGGSRCCGCSSSSTELQQTKAQLQQCMQELALCQARCKQLADELAQRCPDSHLLSEASGQVSLVELFSHDDSSLIETTLDELAAAADKHNMVVFVSKFSELLPGQSLQDHVCQLVRSGTCPHPSAESPECKNPDALVFVSARAFKMIGCNQLSVARKIMALYWSGESVGLLQNQRYTPLHQKQEWETLVKNVMNGNYGRYVSRSILPGNPGQEAQYLCNLNQAVVLVDGEGRRHWGMVYQTWSSPPLFRQRWGLRDLHSNKLTLFCSTYVAVSSGIILSQNATSMSVFGSHGVFHTETGLEDDSAVRSEGAQAPAHEGAASASGAGSSYKLGSHNFLDMLFEARNDELARLNDVVMKEVYRLDGLEIVNPLLRSWMGVQPEQEVYHDLQISLNVDPITFQQVYAISQIDVTDRVLAERQLQLAHAELSRDKECMASLMSRQGDLIACLGKVNDMGKTVTNNTAVTGMLDSMRKQMVERSDSLGLSLAVDDEIVKLEVLGEGSYGTIFKALWSGMTVAVKSVLLPLSMSAGKRRETMAIMEAAISSSLNHPNIVQTYTYRMQPVRGAAARPSAAGSPVPSSHSSPQLSLTAPPDVPRHKRLMAHDSSVGITAFEVQLVLELCDRGSLRHALDSHVFVTPAGDLDYRAVLETAVDIAKGMQHLHKLDIIHSDLKALNVLLQSNTSESRGFSAKISDFGLSLKLDESASSVENKLQGTLAYIAPEVLSKWIQSHAADVYAFGITLWELFTGGVPLKTVPPVMLTQQVVVNGLRPSFPPETPPGFAELAQRCWDASPDARPSFDEVLSCLEQLLLSAQDTPLLVRAPSAGGDCPDIGDGRAGGRAALPPNLDSPAEQMICILEQVLQNEEVDMDEVARLHSTMLSFRDMRQPINLSSKMRSLNLDDDVRQALLRLLAGPEAGGGDAAAQPSLLLGTVQEDAGGREDGAAAAPPLRTKSATRDASAAASSAARLAAFQSLGETEVLQLLAEPVDAVLVVLADLDSWHFDTIALDHATEGHALSTLAFALVRRFHSGILRGLIDEVYLARFLLRVEAGYRDLPYHNKVHAADVVHAMYVIMTQGGVLRSAWSGDHDMVLLMAIFAAAIHDYEHLGLTNDFLIKSHDPLALRYNDRSPMENHHLAAAFGLLHEEQHRFLHRMPEQAQAALRRQVIDMVLATDMKQHFSMVSLFNTKFPASPGSGSSTGGGSRHSSSRTSSSRTSPNQQPLRGGSALRGSLRGSTLAPGKAGLGLDEDTLSLVLQMTMKCADLRGLGLPMHMHAKWAYRLEEEMFQQGDREHEAGLPISPLMDRHSPKGGATRSQSGFFSFVALPMFQSFSVVFPGIEPLLEGVKANHLAWAAEGK